MAAPRKKAKRPKPGTVTRSSFRSVEITIAGNSTEHGTLAQVIGESFAMAREGLSGTFKVNGIRADVKVTRS